ncbi:MAG: hypothetical protein NT170_04430 [Candidatus Moranbacteria bacterium]|nr:hypothetical protein [Candidatus Moranbacteria bacterium]
MQKRKRTIAKVFTAFLAVSFFCIAKTQLVFGQWDKTKLTGTGLSSTSLSDIISKFALWILGIFGFIAVIGFVISGLIYLTSAGDEDAQERAKRAMIYSITGVIVGLVGLVVIYATDSFLHGNADTGSSGVINSAANSPAAGASVPK